MTLNFGYLAILQCLVTLTLSHETPTISYISQEQIRDIGGQVDLDCFVQYAGEYPVLWVKYDRNKPTEYVPLSTNSVLIIRDFRFSLRVDSASTTYTLSIKDVKEGDAGWYQCQVIISNSNKITAEVELQVKRPPIIYKNSTHSVVASEEESVKLECYADGVPSPKISWRREDNANLPTGGSIFRGNVLTIAAVHKEDRGTYYCVAENGVGKGVRRNINLQVEFAPVVTIPRPRLGQALQYDMDLYCHIEAYPPAAVIWVKDDVQLSNNEHYRIMHFSTADELTDSTISVIKIEKSQYGFYKCKAVNKLGTDEGQVELFALDQRAPTISHISQEQISDVGGQVDLNCSVQFAGEYPVLWVKYNQYRPTESIPLSSNSALLIRDSRFSIRRGDAPYETYTWSIRDIQETDAGVYQCQVILSYKDKITAEVELHVRQPTVILDNSTSSLVAREEDSVKMECYANGFPLPTISWRRENNAILPTGGSVYRGNVLTITAVHKEDRGTYYCVADNGVGKAARRNIDLKVEFAPVVTVPNTTLGQALQYDMDLDCHVEAYPPPAIVWVKDDVQLSSNQHYTISHFSTADEVTDTKIRVMTIEKSQYGSYTCKAVNKLGTGEGEVKLYETNTPVCPPACGPQENKETTAIAP